MNFFDTAIGYQSGTSEQYVGRAIRDFAKREDVVVATKFLPRTEDEIASRISGQQHIERMLNTSLINLGLDYWGTTYSNQYYLFTLDCTPPERGNKWEEIWCDYRLDGMYSEIVGTVVLNGEAKDTDRDDVYFALYGDGELLYQSNPLAAGCAAQRFDIELSGVTTLRAVTNDNSHTILRVVDCI